MIFPPALRISTCLCEWICGNNLMTGLYFPKARPLYSVMVFNYLLIFFFWWNCILPSIFSWLTENDMNLCFPISPPPDGQNNNRLV